MTTISKEKLLDIIKQNFATSPIPEKIVERTGGGTEPQRVINLCSGKEWPEIDSQSARQVWGSSSVGEALFYMCDEAFRYYLPAFLTIAIQSNSDDRQEICESIFTALGTQPSSVEDTGTLRPGIDNFLPQEKFAVSQFLKYCQEQTPSDDYMSHNDWLLSIYWKKFLSNNSSI